MSSKNCQADQDFDLFGNPLLPLKDPRGRKAFGKSKKNQRLVIDLRASGMTHGEIATVLGCDDKTLRKYYSRELHEGALLVKAEAVSVLMQKMRTGNMAAVKQVVDMTNLQTTPTKKPDAAKPKEAPLGKKEQLERSASEPTAGWGDLLGDGKPVN